MVCPMSTNKHNRSLRQIALLRAKTIADMKATGRTWDEIGQALGVSRQRAQQIGSRYIASDKAAPVTPAEASEALAP